MCSVLQIRRFAPDYDHDPGGDSMKKRHGCLHSLFVLLLVAVILAGFLYVQNNVIQTEQIPLLSPKLPAGFDGLRVVELSDLHGKEFGADNEKLLTAVREAEPALITLNGDIADEYTDLSMLAPLAEGLVAIAPTYYVTGNHEWVMEDLSAMLAILETAGVRVLHNEYVTLTRDGQSVVLAGVDDPNGPYDQKTPAQLMDEIRAACGENTFVLMLSHRNDRLDMWAQVGADVVLTGHGHGGVIRLPYFGPLLGVDRDFFPEYSAGLYTQAGTTMMVSRGLGNSGVPQRLFNRPHLPVLILRQS